MKTERIFARINSDLKERFKKLCELRDESMSDNLTRHIKSEMTRITDNRSDYMVVDSFNRLSREVRKSLPFYNGMALGDKIQRMIEKDSEIRPEIDMLLERMITQMETEDE